MLKLSLCRGSASAPLATTPFASAAASSACVFSSISPWHQTKPTVSTLGVQNLVQVSVRVRGRLEVRVRVRVTVRVGVGVRVRVRVRVRVQVRV